ncbi:MAG: endonuclease-3 [Oceanicoccus sp.]|jgi:endonuclease-3
MKMISATQQAILDTHTMNKENTVQLVQILAHEFPDPQAPLTHRNAFELLIAVILSAQCTDARVNTVTPHLFHKDTPCKPQDLLDLGEDEVKRIIHPCGYFNSKTKALMGSAMMLQGKEVPNDFDELIKLPGVGGKTAQVVLAQWYGQDTFPVDTHIHRVCNRLGVADSGKNRDKTERQMKAAIPKENWSALHLQIIFHGRKTCTAYKPKCGDCPLKEICEWDSKTPMK